MNRPYITSSHYFLPHHGYLLLKESSSSTLCLMPAIRRVLDIPSMKSNSQDANSRLIVVTSEPTSLMLVQQSVRLSRPSFSQDPRNIRSLTSPNDISTLVTSIKPCSLQGHSHLLRTMLKT